MNNYTDRPVMGYTSLGISYRWWGWLFEGSAPRGNIGSCHKLGTDNPNFRNQIINLQDASTDYLRHWVNPEVEGWIDVTSVYQQDPGTWSRCFGYWASLNTSSITDSYEEAVTRDIALSKIKRKIASDKEDYAVLTNLVQDVYEFQKTIHGTLDSIANLLKNFQHVLNRHRPGGKAGTLRAIADLYLSWTFGINPTIKDAIELAKSIQAYIDRKDHVKRFQASHYSDMNKVQISTHDPIYGISLDFTEVLSRRYSCKYISTHNMQLLSGNNYGLSDHFHLAPTDFVPMLWELLPWSWLVDYFVTVGPWLDDVFQSEIHSSIYNLQCIMDRVAYAADVQVRPYPGWVITNKTVIPRRLDGGTFTRTRLAALPGRMLRFRTKYELENNVLKKLTNLVAVLATKTLR